MMRVEILSTVLNGMPYLREQIASLQSQTHCDWKLHVRDDGSTDDTVDFLKKAASEDPRIHIVEDAGGRRGARGGFGWLLQNTPAEGDYTMFCDQDDVWLPRKIEASLARMRQVEAESPDAPVLVHTDLMVVDEDLRVLGDSFWKYQGIRPRITDLRPLLTQNSVTGCAAMINRRLREMSSPVPAEVVMHDWWIALIAVAFGRIAQVDEPMVLYRQHGRNSAGAWRVDDRPLQLLGDAIRALGNGAALRGGILDTTRQASAFLERFGDRLMEDQRELVERYAEIPGCGPIQRKIRFLELGTLTHRGFLRNLGLLLRV